MHARVSNQRYCKFCLPNISSIGWFRMERALKWGKHLWWWEIMAFICRWQCWWDHGPEAEACTTNCYFPIYCNPLQCPGWEPICVARDCLVAWGVMGREKVVIVLNWLACVAVFLSFINFSMCLLSSSKKSPRLHWSMYSITLCRPKRISLSFHKKTIQWQM